MAPTGVRTVSVLLAPMVAWLLYEINRDPVLLEQIREEIAPFMNVVQPKNDFGLAVWMAPEMRKVDVEGLVACRLTTGCKWRKIF